MTQHPVAVAVRRPVRAHAVRNHEALLAAARDLFAERGADASLEEIARRAGVGIGTLYRNFPSRRDLFDAVYRDAVGELCGYAAEVAAREPWEAFAAWLDRLAGHVAAERALHDALSRDSDAFPCRTALHAAGAPLFARAQAGGAVRADTSLDDVLRMLTGILGGRFTSGEQRERVVRMALDGVRAAGEGRPGPPPSGGTAPVGPRRPG